MSELVTDDQSDRYKIPLLIGVSGHRDLVDTEIPLIRSALETALASLRDAARDVQLKLLSSMAEGADLLAAEVAESLGIGVFALLPYDRAQCRNDLRTDAARASFDRILRSAEHLEVALPKGAIRESLATDQGLRDHQFQRAGMLVARYSSLLIAVWNGESTQHAAGTARVVEYRRRGFGSGSGLAGSGDMLLGAADNDLLYEILCSRTGNGNDHGDGGARRNGASGVKVVGFVQGDVVCGPVEQGIPSALSTLLERTGEFNRDVSEYGDQIATRGRKLSPPTPRATPESLLYVDRLFTAADWLGVHFRGAFTRALRARYALWALLAFLLLAFKKEQDGTFALLSILGVLAIFGIGGLLAVWAHRRNWQRRYLDYRALAEGLRVEFYWELSGVRVQFGDEFAHESFLQKQDVDLEWIRAAMRAVSLRCALAQPAPLAEGFAHTFAAWIGDAHPASGSGQLQYYRARTHTLEKRQENSEHIARWSLYGGLCVGVVLAVDAFVRYVGQSLIPEEARHLLLWALALLTVYGAIFEIYLGEKADRALIRQYRYMGSLFGFAARELSVARQEIDRLEILRSLGHACLAEHAQWILAHRDKRIEGMRW